MIPVSEDYQTAVQGTVRLIRPRVDVTWTDPSIDLTLSASSNDDNRATRNEQTADLVTVMSHKWLHLDSTNKLNGSFFAMPGVGETNQCGWYGATECNASKVWTGTNPLLTLEFAARPVNSIRISGDSEYSEYPEDFIIRIYNGASLLVTDAITGNNEIHYTTSGTAFNSVTKITLEIVKWSAANRVVKIAEFYGDVISRYEGGQVKSLSLLEERELADNSLPVGNISCNEINLEIENVTDSFFPGNTDSPIHTVIKKNRKIEPYLGVFKPAIGAFEYVPLGVFWSGDWTVPEQGTIASTAARDRMELLRKLTYDKSDVWNNISLYTLAGYLLTEAQNEMPDLEYNIESALTGYTVEWAYFPRQSYFDCLRDIAAACTGQVYMDRFDTLQVIGPQ